VFTSSLEMERYVEKACPFDLGIARRAVNRRPGCFDASV